MATFLHKSFQVYYHIYGQGKTIILLHGFGETGNIWKNQIDYLQANFKVIVPNLPGSGKSPFNEAIQSISDYADCLIELITQTCKNDFIILGHSMGGYITLELAEKLKNDNHFKGFGLIHSTAFADTDEKKETRRKAIDYIQKKGAFSFLKTSIPSLFGTNYAAKNLQTIDNLITEAKVFKVDAIVGYFNAMINRKDNTLTLQSSNLPILFIIGTEDMAVKMTDLMKQVHLPPISYIKILQNVGHMGMIEAKDEVNETIVDFAKNCFE